MKTIEHTPENITELEENQVFVFGSNLGGIHGKGAAKTARDKFGAKMGRGNGTTGQCYAIPTKDRCLITMSLTDIAKFVEAFKEYARQCPEKEFLVTKIGCGLAGLSEEDVSPMFWDSPANVVLPEGWLKA